MKRLYNFSNLSDLNKQTQAVVTFFAGVSTNGFYLWAIIYLITYHIG